MIKLGTTFAIMWAGYFPVNSILAATFNPDMAAITTICATVATGVWYLKGMKDKVDSLVCQNGKDCEPLRQIIRSVIHEENKK